jgi:membrane-associated phospholipid phosphatase
MFIQTVRVVIWMVTIVGIASLLSCRMHYSIDVLLAVYFTFTVWYGYDIVDLLPKNAITQWISDVKN